MPCQEPSYRENDPVQSQTAGTKHRQLAPTFDLQVQRHFVEVLFSVRVQYDDDIELKSGY